MNRIIMQWLDSYKCRGENETVDAVREIMQELAIQGLWRGKFFEKAAFYGGTALRILYGLPRSSEDLDFSLLRPTPDFRLSSYAGSVKRELEAYGFKVDFVVKDEKKHASRIDSAFLKGNTRLQLISIGLPETLIEKVHSRTEIKIKLEIDTDPPAGFTTESKNLLMPSMHAVRVYALPDLLAGKLHAVLCRKWGHRVKGRDWYDMVWYAGHHPLVNLRHLQARMIQSGNDDGAELLTMERLRNRLLDAVDGIDIKMLMDDVRPFVRDQRELELWSKDFFREVVMCFREVPHE